MTRILILLASFSCLFSISSVYAASTLPRCVGAYNSVVWDNCSGATILSEAVSEYWTGDHYSGEWRGGKPHGRGVLTSKDGDLVYRGEMKSGMFHGQGTLTLPHGTYEGEFKEDDISGEGTMHYSDGGKYVGQWRNSSRGGMGIMIDADGYKYEGEWTEDRPHGEGTVTHPNGDWYSGDWRNGKEHGEGTYFWADDGTRYTGEFRNGEFHGYGVETYKDGSSITGRWINGEVSANQEEVSIQDEYGRRYKGQIRNNLPHGRGVLEFAILDSSGTDQISVSGKWNDGTPVGEMLVNTSSGFEYVGQLNADGVTGEGRVVYKPLGVMYVGEFRKGIPRNGVIISLGGEIIDVVRDGKRVAKLAEEQAQLEHQRSNNNLSVIEMLGFFALGMASVAQPKRGTFERTFNANPWVAGLDSEMSGTRYMGCSSDVECGLNRVCIKRLGSGRCLEPVTRFGTPIFKRFGLTRKVGLEGQCRSLLDCPIGFSCDRDIRVCVSRW